MNELSIPMLAPVLSKRMTPLQRITKFLLSSASLVCAALQFGGAVATATPAPPANFAVEDVLLGLEQPMAIRFLPDGRMLLLQKKGAIQIVNVSTTPAQSQLYMNLADPAHTAGLVSDEERGVIDVAIDPNFPTAPYIYLFYTPASGPNGAKSRIARFTHVENSGGLTSRGNLASEVILWQDTDGYDSCCHYGGGLDFGPDGNLWLTVGEHFQGSYASSLQHAGGKVHRITKTGTIPAGNPYADGNGSNVDSVFAYGLRNPFRSRWDVTSGRYFIGEVGGNTQSTAWEDLHLIKYNQATSRFVDKDYGTGSDNGRYDGINFGWPTVEGLPPHTDFPGAVIDPVVGEPIFAYKHSGVTAAITGGVVYRATRFPAQYQGAYFYADSTRDFVRYLKFNADGSVSPNPNPAPLTDKNPDAISYSFDLTPLGRIISLEVGPDGGLYYVSFTDSGGAYGEPNPSVLGSVRRYVYDNGNARPDISVFSVSPSSGHSPLPVTFSIRAADPESDPMTYVVNFGDGTTTGAPRSLAGNSTVTVTHTYQTDGLYSARLDVSDPSHTTSQTVSVAVGTPPTITTLTSSNSRVGSTANMFRFGDTITFSATATDAEDGALGGARFSWSIVFVRVGNIHPAFGPQTGTTSIDFPIPSQGQGFSGPVYYRCFLTVTDSSGLSTTSSIDIFPEKSNITFDSVPRGIVVQIDGNTATPTLFVLDTLINYNHVITVPAVQCVNGTKYVFSNWSNGPTTAQQTYNVPTTDSALTAYYTASGPCALLPATGLVMHLDGNAGINLSGSNVVSWADQTANANNLTASGNPYLLNGEFIGQTVVHFDGVDDALSRSGFTGLPTGSGNRSVFMVVRYNAANANGGGWVGFTYGTALDNQAFGLSLTPSGTLGVQGWGTSNDLQSNPAKAGVGKWLNQGAVLSGGTLTQYTNGVGIGTAAHTYGTGTGGVRLGEELNGNKNLNMDVAEVLVYNRAVSATELQQIEDYFDQRYVSGSSGNPPVVTITSPASGSSFTTSQLPITLTATATDQQDGNIGTALSWTSSLDGSLGSGPSITVSLSTGTHVITATAVDSSALQGSASINVTVTSSGGSGGLVTSGLVVKLESDLNVSIQSGSTVAGWLDQSGLGNDLVAGGSPQIGLVQTPTGKPAISLNGSGGKLERINATSPLGGLPTGNADRTIMLVAKYNNSTAWAGLAYGTGANNQAFGLNVKSPSGELVFQGWGGGNDLISTTPGIGAGWLLQEGVLSGGTATLYKDGAQIAQWTHTYNTVLTKLVIGQEIASLGYAGMDVAAVLVYNRALNASERTSVESYLRNKFLQSGSGNTPPTVTISAPANGSTFVSSASINFTAAANDAEQGNLSSSIQWSSNLDGPLGTGGSITHTLSSGSHTITASVTDSGSLTASASVTVTVSPAANSAPVVSISAPASGLTFTRGASISFAATANDAEQGNLGSSIQWNSNLDGPLGTGGSISVNTLSSGTHTITASVTDNGNLTGSANVSVIIDAVAPPLIGNLVLHLESTQGLVTSGSKVTSWTDLSSQHNTVSAVGNPQLVAAQTPSGRPAISFNGISDDLERLSSTSPLSGLPTGNANRAMFLVAKYDGASVSGGAAYGNGANNRTFGLVVKPSTGQLMLQGWGGNNDLVSSTPGIGAGWLLQSAVLNNGTATLYKNGAQIAQWAHTYNTLLSKLEIGGEIKSGYVDMDVAAVLIYNRALSASERASVESYLQTKYLQAPGQLAFNGSLVSPSSIVGDLNLRIVELRDGSIRLQYPDLKPIGNYYLHAVTNLATQLLSDPANRVGVVMKSQIEVMDPAERSGVTFDYPTTNDGQFFQLFLELIEPALSPRSDR